MEKKRSAASSAVYGTLKNVETSRAVQVRPVQANIPQELSANINIRVVPGRDFEFYPIKKKCKSRTGVEKKVAESLDLPVSLRDKLKSVNKQVIDWLAEDQANTKLFLAQPVVALAKAGVELTRVEQKHLLRTHQEVNDAMVVAPGVNVELLDTKVYKRGKIGKIKPTKPNSDQDDHSVGCAKE
ncbi:MAG: hypothetical protein HWD86_03365 [Kangiellaceae bacterium]|nr:hypothetical protein [Kangiellaceae bacterium]